MALSHSKKTTTLLRGTTSKHHGEFYCLNCLHSFPTEKKFESHKKKSENEYFCNVIMPSGDTKVLEFNRYEKSDDGCKNNRGSSFTNIFHQVFQCLQYHHLKT